MEKKSGKKKTNSKKAISRKSTLKNSRKKIKQFLDLPTDGELLNKIWEENENNDDYQKRYQEARDLIYKNSPGRAVFSACIYDTEGIPVNNLEEVAVKGKVVFIKEYDPFWDHESNGKGYISEVVESPTWYQLMELAGDMIETTGDIAHLYLEGFEIIGKLSKSIKVAAFAMGS